MQYTSADGSTSSATPASTSTPATTGFNALAVVRGLQADERRLWIMLSRAATIAYSTEGQRDDEVNLTSEDSTEGALNCFRRFYNETDIKGRLTTAKACLDAAEQDLFDLRRAKRLNGTDSSLSPSTSEQSPPSDYEQQISEAQGAVDIARGEYFIALFVTLTREFNQTQPRVKRSLFPIAPEIYQRRQPRQAGNTGLSNNRFMESVFVSLDKEARVISNNWKYLQKVRPDTAWTREFVRLRKLDDPIGQSLTRAESSTLTEALDWLTKEISYP